MNTASPFERAAAYLNVQLSHSAGPGEAPPVGPFVTISRQSGAGGSALAQALAERLPRHDENRPWMVYSANLIEEMLRHNHLPPQLARFLPEDRISVVDAEVGELVGLHPNLWTLVRKTNELIRQLAHAGSAILLGRGANFATAAVAHGVHVRLVAAEEYRAARTAHWLSISPGAAMAHNRARDAARRRYVRATFEADIADPSGYDVLLNVERLPLEAMVELIAQLVARESPVPTARLERIDVSSFTIA
jgi:cytidylate kinase